MLTIEIEGAEEVIARFNAGIQLTPIQMLTGMNQAVGAVRQDAAVYPPETDANQPPPPYYIRGVGTQLAEGNLGESEQMGTRWTGTVKMEGADVVGEVDNTASYAPHTHGRRGQRYFHKARGWRKVTDIAKQTTERVRAVFENVAKTIAGALGGA